MNSCCFNMFCSNLKPPSEKLVLMIWASEDQSSFEVVCALWLFQRTGQNLSLLCGSRLLGIDMILVLVEIAGFVPQNRGQAGSKHMCKGVYSITTSLIA